jgi:osmotically-inducible protein OsmY
MSTGQELMDEVRAKLALEPGIDIDKVQVEIRDGIVFLTGHVPSLTEMHFAESCVMRVQGVHAVVNQLSLAPVRQ